MYAWSLGSLSKPIDSCTLIGLISIDSAVSFSHGLIKLSPQSFILYFSYLCDQVWLNYFVDVVREKYAFLLQTVDIKFLHKIYWRGSILSNWITSWQQGRCMCMVLFQKSILLTPVIYNYLWLSLLSYVIVSRFYCFKITFRVCFIMILFSSELHHIG